MPLLRRNAYRRPRFPGPWFVMLDDKGYEDGPHEASTFQHLGDGVWASQMPPGHPVFLRVTRQSGEHVWTVDGGGKEWHYRLLAVDPEVP